MISNFRQRLLASTLLIGAAALSTPAMAQDAQTPPPPPPPTEDVVGDEPGIETTADPTPGPTQQQQTEQAQAQGDIVVTGSRIARPDLSSTSPLAVVNDEEFTLSGAVNVEQVINTLPQVAPGTTAFSNNPGGGVATINLRGLGSTRNLVLVNGRRYIFFSTSQVVDVNTIPAFLIDSVDVVTGGASAVYGSDALAGVVNFKLRGVRGFETGGQVNITEKGDGRRWNLYGAIGTDVADGRGNITVFGEYFNRAPVFAGDRDYTAPVWADAIFLGVSDAPTGGTARFGEPIPGLIPFGSVGVPEGRFVTFPQLTIGGTVYPIGAGTNYPGLGAFFGEPGVSTPFSSVTDAYNFGPSNYIMVPQERFSLGGFGDYEITPFATAYVEATFINNVVKNELAPTPITQNVNFPLAVIEDMVSAEDFAQLQLIAERQQAAIAAAAAAGTPNPFGPLRTGSVLLPALQPGEVRLQVNTRTTGIGPRVSNDERNSFRLLGGFRGDITSDLNYDLYYMYARTRNSQIQEGNVSRTAFVAGATSGLCNFFGRDLLSPECVDSLEILASNSTRSTLQVAQGSVSGSVFTLPWATNPIGFAAGAEWRKMAAEFIPDTALSSGDVVGFNAGNPTEGRYDVRELFGEVRIPIVEDGFIQHFSVNAAGRLSDYSLKEVGTVPTYAVGAELAPIRDIRFRAQYQRAVRAPNVAELFGGQSIGFPAATDPCATAAAATNPTIRDVCIATGVPAANVGQSFLQPNAQIQGAFGGNPDLQEEVGDTLTFGAVFQPRFIPRLSATVDYYDIRVENVISAAGGGVANILNLCYNVIQNASSAICQLISRDPQGVISGPPFVVTATQANLASLESRGIDFQVDYNVPLNFSIMGAGRSRLSAFFIANRNLQSDVTPLVDLPEEVIVCEGRFGLDCGDPTPKWSWTSRLTFQDGPMTTSFRWRHLGSVRDDDDTTDYAVERVPAYDVFDLSFAFNVSDNMTFNMGVNNLFNKKPPIIGLFNNEQSNTYPGTYNPLGRDFFVSTNLRF